MEQVGEYLIKRLIGEGGMGKVYEAEERLSKRKVALKILHQNLATDDNGRALFINEMGILARLDHPNVVRCLACMEHDGKLVMALEYLEGQTLRAKLSGGRLQWDEAVAIATDVARGLAAAHKDPPIIHRDLKPENIMIGPDGRAKVMDFGVAKVLQSMTRHTTQAVGTLQYMSPEQIDATGLDPRSDYYCLGLVLYEMLAGTPPFQSESPRELLNLQCTAEPPPLPDDVRRGLPRGIENLLFRLLQKSPDERPATAQEILDVFEVFGAADGSSAQGTSTVPPTGSSQNNITQVPELSTPPAQLNTVQLMARAREQSSEVSRTAAIAVVVSMSLLAAVVTYVIRLVGS